MQYVEISQELSKLALKNIISLCVVPISMIEPQLRRALLSAAEGQRPSNYSSCCCSWIFRLVYALSTSTTVLPPFFKYFKSIHCCCFSWIFHLLYALSTSTTVLPPICLNILNLLICLSINPFSSIFFCQTINRPLPFPKYQYIIAADRGAGSGPC